eukprot:1883759-Prymnesium_polylepis.2
MADATPQCAFLAATRTAGFRHACSRLLSAASYRCADRSFADAAAAPEEGSSPSGGHRQSADATSFVPTSPQARAAHVTSPRARAAHVTSPQARAAH